MPAIAKPKSDKEAGSGTAGGIALLYSIEILSASDVFVIVPFLIAPPAG